MQDFRDYHNGIIDGLRAIAILLVILFHTNYVLVKLLPGAGILEYINTSPAIFNIGWYALGSEIIFFLSAYLLTYIALIEINKTGTLSLRNFYLKRAARILPLYYLALGIFTLAGYSGLIEITWHPESWLANLLFVSKLAGKQTIIPVGWSLELQVQFYLAFPLLLWLLTKLKQPVLLLLIFVLGSVWLRYNLITGDPETLALKYHDMVLGEATSRTQRDSYHLIYYRMSVLFLGMLFAWLVSTHREKLASYLDNRAVSYAVTLTGVVLIVVSGFLPIHREGSLFYELFDGQAYVFYMATNRLFFILGLLLVLAKLLLAAGHFGIVGKALGNRVFRLLSQTIYPLYLFHIIFIFVAVVIVYQTTDKDMITSVSTGQLLGLLFLATLFATLFSYAIHKFIELPCQRFIRGRWLRQHEH